MDSKNEWLEVSLRVPPEAVDAVSAFLFDAGCSGIREESHEGLLVAYFPTEAEQKILPTLENFFQDLSRIFPGLSGTKPSIKRVVDERWELRWREHFKPQVITPSLMVIPPWESPQPRWEGHILVIDPGPAFGTGQHPTTRMCLKALEQCVRGTGEDVLDVGTGSGILAIYAAKLGARRVVGIDVDVEAVRWAKRNLSFNSLEGHVLLAASGPDALRGSFQTVLANLTVNEIMKIKPELIRLLTPGGRLVLSGLLTHEVEGVMAEYEREGLYSMARYQEGEWGALILEKSSWREES